MPGTRIAGFYRSSPMLCGKIFFVSYTGIILYGEFPELSQLLNELYQFFY